jgi:glycosyltransferase involved in cell wall biosynthesis
LKKSIELAARHSDGFIFSSHYARALYRRDIKAVRQKPSQVIPPAASLKPQECRAEPVSIGGDILFVSHLYPYKMVEELIQGYDLARHRGVQNRLVIAGAMAVPEYHRAIIRLIDDLGLAQMVTLTGALDGAQLEPLYTSASLFVFPSLSENAGSYALIDAFSFGIPVLSSFSSSMPEACQSGARYFDARSPEHVAEEIVRALTSTTRLRAMADASKARGAELPSWIDIAEALCEFCKGLIH